MPSVKIQKTVLVVEDDLAMQGILVRKLRLKNYNVLQASDGKTALQTIRREKPDLVLLDLMLPEMNGFDILLHLRNDDDPAITRTPVIVLTNLYGQDDVNRATSLNIQGYIVKAYLTTEEIAVKVEEVLKTADRPATTPQSET